MFACVVLLIFFSYVEEITSVTCPSSVKEGAFVQLTQNVTELGGPYIWRPSHGQFNISCGHCGSPCERTTDPPFSKCVVYSAGNNTYKVSLNIHNVSLPEDAVTWILFDNNTLLGECNLLVYSLENPPECSDVELDDSGSKLKWSCNVSRVYPQAKCLVEYGNNQTYDSQVPQELISSTHILVSNTSYNSSVCTMEAPIRIFETGKYRFRMGMYPDVPDGLSQMKTTISDEIFVAHRVDDGDSDGPDSGAIVGTAFVLGIIFCIACFVLGYYVGKGRIRFKKICDNSENQGETPKNENNDGFKINAMHESGNQRHKPQGHRTTTATKPPPNLKQLKQQQAEEDLYLDPTDPAELYVNQSDLDNSNATSNISIESGQVYESLQPSNTPLAPPEKPPNYRNSRDPPNYRNSRDPPNYRNSRDPPNPRRDKTSQSSETDKNSMGIHEADVEYLQPTQTVTAHSSNTWRENEMLASNQVRSRDDTGTPPVTQDTVYEMMPSSQLGQNSTDSKYPDDEYLEPDELKAQINNSKAQTVPKEFGRGTHSSSGGDSCKNNDGDVYEIPQANPDGHSEFENSRDDLYLNSTQALEYYNT